MHTFQVIALIVAAVCFFLDTVGVASRFNLTALGLLAWVLTVLIPLAF